MDGQITAKWINNAKAERYTFRCYRQYFQVADNRMKVVMRKVGVRKKESG